MVWSIPANACCSPPSILTFSNPFDAVLRYEMFQRDAREAMTPREFVRAFLVDHGFKLSDRRADDARDWAQSWLYANRA